MQCCGQVVRAHDIPQARAQIGPDLIHQSSSDLPEQLRWLRVQDHGVKHRLAALIRKGEQLDIIFKTIKVNLQLQSW